MAQDGADRFPTDWSHDGKYILYEQGADLWFVTLPEQKSSLFLKAPSSIKIGRFSPDGKWVAYASNESGRWEIYVTSFPQAHGKWQILMQAEISRNGEATGENCFTFSRRQDYGSVRDDGANFDAGAPTALFQANAREGVATSEQVSYDIDKDGQKFLINTQLKQGETLPMSVVLNWPAKLNDAR